MSLLQVNNNGVISFTRAVSTFTPEPFPLGNGLQLIAPYWADVDTRGTGQVWYRETDNRHLLDRAQREISLFPTTKFCAHQPLYCYLGSCWLLQQ